MSEDHPTLLALISKPMWTSKQVKTEARSLRLKNKNRLIINSKDMITQAMVDAVFASIDIPTTLKRIKESENSTTSDEHTELQLAYDFAEDREMKARVIKIFTDRPKIWVLFISHTGARFIVRHAKHTKKDGFEYMA